MTTTPDPAQPDEAQTSVPQPTNDMRPESAQPHTNDGLGPATAQQTQPTTPLPAAESSAPYVASPQPGTYAQAHPDTYAQPGAHTQHTTAAPATPATPAATKSRAGVLFAGIAIGAIVGGVIGGGASAIIVANQQPAAVVQSTTGSPVTLNNTATATNVSGVALAATPSVVTLEVTGRSAAGSGSGVVYSEDGYIVTNAHVVTLDGTAGSDTEIRVWLADGRILDGELIGTDPFADLAVVKVDAEGLQALELADSENINVGDLAIAIGAPLNLSNTVTSGVVSALNRGISVGSASIPDNSDDEVETPDDNSGEFPWYRFEDPNGGLNGQQQERQSRSITTAVTLPVVQTDASINPGNSGGALLNANAELIGINVAIASNGSDSSTAGSDGLGFAIPVNMVERVADSIIAGERPSHGLLGVSVADSKMDTDEDRNFAGGLISELVRGGAAEEGGLRVGDVITAIDGIPVDSGTTASALVRMHAGGDEVVISYTRGGQPGEAAVTLGELEW